MILSMFDPGAWRDFFTMVGGGSAALTGLVFVVMTLHLQAITADAVHRHRARTILAGFTAVFIRCGLVLMANQSRQAIAIEIVGVLLIVEFVFSRSLLDAFRTAGKNPQALLRGMGSFACLMTEQVGAIVLFSGHNGGLYVVGIGMLASFIFTVSGAWLLLVGTGPIAELRDDRQ